MNYRSKIKYMLELLTKLKLIIKTDCFKLNYLAKIRKLIHINVYWWFFLLLLFLQADHPM